MQSPRDTLESLGSYSPTCFIDGLTSELRSYNKNTPSNRVAHKCVRCEFIKKFIRLKFSLGKTVLSL